MRHIEAGKRRYPEIIQGYPNRYQVLQQEGGDLEEDQHEVEKDFEVMRKAYTEVADTVLGKPRKKKKPWIT